MSRVYDNWERLVTATLRREELRLTALRTPSDLSSASASAPASPSCFNFSSSSHQKVPSYGLTGLSSSSFWEFVPDYGGHLASIDWKTRLKIAIRAGESWPYLPHECISWVRACCRFGFSILDDNFQASLGSFLDLCTEREHHHSTISQTRAFEGDSSGTTQNALIPCDAYWFGMFLLELITGKLGFSAADHHTMMDWMAHFLALIVQDNQELVLHIVDPSLVIDNHLLAEIWGVALVAKACLGPTSSNLPQMVDILSALKSIESARLETYGVNQPTEDPLSVDLALITKLLKDSKIIGNEEGYPNEEILDGSNLLILSFSELKDATRNLTIQTVADNVEDESVYKAWLQRTSMSNSSDGMLISVRQYYSHDMEELDIWQSQAEKVGRLSHPNLVKFLGQFLKDQELFLVNEFVQNGSLEKHLFKRSASPPLSLEIRLKILIGAACGLEFLHAKNSQSFYESFESSDILLDNDYNVKLLGFRKATTGRPNAFGDLHQCFSNDGRYVYADPLYVTIHKAIITGFTPMDSDVYGFGVVLLEMLTGFPAKGYHIRGSGAPRFVEFCVSRMSQNGQVKNIMDSRLEDQYNIKTAGQLVALGLTCTLPDPKARPSMSEVLKKLKHIESHMKKPSL